MYISKLVFFLCLIAASQLLAQDHTPPIQWEEVPQADLDMTVYEKDPEAGAVVLADYGVIRVLEVNNIYQCQFERHRRIKILDKRSFDQADIEIPFYKRDQFSEFEAQTINGDGSTYQVEETDFFEEDLSLYYKTKKFSFPNVQEGSVLEYRYHLNSFRLTELPDWYFQGELPTKYSELNVDINYLFDYVFLFQGKKKLKTSSQIDGLVEVRDDQFIMRHAPALKEQTYCTTIDNYRTRIRFQLGKIHYVTRPPETFLTSWDKLILELKNNNEFGKQYRSKRNYNKVWQEIEPLLIDVKSTTETTKIIYKYVQKNIVWDRYYGVFTDESLDQIYTKGKGNIAAINLMLVALLNEAGIEAYPVLSSTRDNGQITKKYPIIDQFNYVLASIKDNERVVLLDASNPYYNLGTIREEALNYDGLLIDNKSFEWISTKAQTSTDILWSQLELQEDGTIEGLFKGRFSGYSALKYRKEYQKNSEKSWTEKLSRTIPDISIEEMTIQNQIDVEQPFSVKTQFNIEGTLQQAGELLYLSPVIYTNFGENPFKSEERLYPVEFPYPVKEQMIVNLKIPAGYSIEALPENVSLTFPEKALSFRFLAEAKGNMITITSRIEINRLIYDTPEYEAIKGFFDTIVESFSEQIVLKKI